jgi:hypothetical protein
MPIDHGFRVYAWTHLLRLVFVVPALGLGVLALYADAPLAARLFGLFVSWLWVPYAVWQDLKRRERLEYLNEVFVGKAYQGSLVLDETRGNWADAPAVADDGIEAARHDWPRATHVNWARWSILFKPGKPGGPKTPVGHFVESGVHVRQDDTIQVQCDPGDGRELLVARVRWGVLQLLDAKSGFHGTEAQHRKHIEDMGITVGL